MKWVRFLCAGAVFLALEAGALGGAARSQAQLKSGIYEGLTLAVDAQGAVTGSYRDEEGEGVTKSCSFFLAGHEKGGEAVVATWSLETFPGSLKAADHGVVLQIENGRDHPGCASVLPPLISEGMLLDLDSPADWTSLRRVIAKRAYLLRKPNDRRGGRGYLVNGDIVGVLARSRDWLDVEYAKEGRRTRGWLRAADTAEIRPP
jgi:hypothetical protein